MSRGALAGKIGSVFFSTATLGGGQETTALTTFTFFAHHGMIIAPIGKIALGVRRTPLLLCPHVVRDTGYTSPLLFSTSEVHGGSPYGAGVIAGGDGSRQPSELELGVALHHGEAIATYALQLAKGRQ